MSTPKFKTVDGYFKTIPQESKERMNAIRSAIKTSAPQAEEVISYNMPALKYKDVLVAYAFFKNHIGFYPTPSAMSRFEKELTAYKRAKGSVQFPNDKPLPIELIKQMTEFRHKEMEEK